MMKHVITEGRSLRKDRPRDACPRDEHQAQYSKIWLKMQPIWRAFLRGQEYYDNRSEGK